MNENPQLESEIEYKLGKVYLVERNSDGARLACTYLRGNWNTVEKHEKLFFASEANSLCVGEATRCWQCKEYDIYTSSNGCSNCWQDIQKGVDDDN